MVDSNVALASEDTDKIAKLPEAVRMDPISTAEAQANIVFLRSQAESWLAVLFNVFGSVGRDNQYMVGDVISSWIAVADAKVVFVLIPVFVKSNIPSGSRASVSETCRTLQTEPRECPSGIRIEGIRVR